jgi:ABC-type Mn2+/Zn2+ transport system ATPase subunit
LLLAYTNILLNIISTLPICPGHSVETALTSIADSVLRSLDQRDGVVMVLLDLSAAFDTVDHAILLKRLEKYFWH